MPRVFPSHTTSSVSASSASFTYGSSQNLTTSHWLCLDSTSGTQPPTSWCPDSRCSTLLPSPRQTSLLASTLIPCSRFPAGRRDPDRKPKSKVTSFHSAQSPLNGPHRTLSKSSEGPRVSASHCPPSLPLCLVSGFAPLPPSFCSSGLLALPETPGTVPIQGLCVFSSKSKMLLLPHLRQVLA